MFCPYPSIFDKPADEAVLVRAQSKPMQASDPGSGDTIDGLCLDATGAATAASVFLSALSMKLDRLPARARRGARRQIKNARAVTPSGTWRIPILLLLAAGLLGFGGATVASDLGVDSLRTRDHDYEAPVPGTYTLPVVKRAADGDVLDSNGRALRLRELTHGRITVLSFIYTRCAAAKACPYATGVLNQLHRCSQQDPSLARNMRLVSMSFDPAGDTPQRMAAYSGWARERKSAAEWRFITTRSPVELQPILDAYGQAVDRKKNPFDPTGPLNHTLRVFLIDREGRIRNIYSSGTLDPRLVLADVRTLMAEPSGAISSQLTTHN